MARYAKWERPIVDAHGNIIPDAFVKVRRMDSLDRLATIFSDGEGEIQKSNEFQTGDDANAVFYAAGGFYQIEVWGVVNGETVSFTLENEAIGTGQAADIDKLGIGANVDVQVNGLSDRDAYDAEDDGFRVLVSDIGDGRAAIYTRVGASGNWTDPAVITGGAGADGPAGSSDVVGTSTSSIEIGMGPQAFTIAEEDRGWGIGARLRASSNADPTDFMEGIVASYSGASLSLTVDLISGSGTHADWTINLAGEPGTDGNDGAGVPPGGTTGQVLKKASGGDYDTEWGDDTGGGGGAVDSVNGKTGEVVLDPDDLDDTSTIHKFTSADEISKLAGIEAGADVTDSENVGAAIAGADEKETINDFDAVPLIDSEDSDGLKWVGWATIKSALKSFFDTLYYIVGGTDVALADGGTGASLSDPNADRLMFWDDSAGEVTWLSPGTNLSISGTTLNAEGGGGQPIPTNSSYAVGIFMLACKVSSSTANNATAAGSSLNGVIAGSSGSLSANGVPLSGTWRNVSGVTQSTNDFGYWVRVS